MPDPKLSEAHRKKKLSPKFIEHQYKAAGDEPNDKLVNFRIPQSLYERIQLYRKVNGEPPWSEVREYLDQILPALPPSQS